MLLNCLAVGLGGLLGSVLRYLLSLFPIKESTLFPIKTFVINILGCTAIGLIAVLSTRNKSFDSRLLLFLKVGICGGFTTFSSFALESVDLIQRGHPFSAFLYVLLSIALGTGVIILLQTKVFMNML